MICMCLVLLFNQNDLTLEEKYIRLNSQFAKFTKEEEILEIAKKSSELLKSELVKESFGNFVRDRLLFMKKEADCILMMEKNQKLSIIESIRNLRNIQDVCASDKNKYNKEEMGDLIDEIRKKMPEGILLIYEAINIKYIFDIEYGFEKFDLCWLDQEYLKSENIFGKNSPELYKIISSYLHYYRKKKDIMLMKKYCQKLKDLIPERYPKRFEIIFHCDLMYLWCLAEKESLQNECFIHYKKMDKSNVRNFNSSNIESRCLYFTICVNMYSNLKSDYNMIEMQEGLIDALVYKYGNKVNPAVKAEATILRDMLAKKNEVKWLRKVEADYNLEPLPKQSDE